MLQQIKNKVFVLGLLSLALGTGSLLSGCSLLRAFEPASIVKHPDAPMLIQETKHGYFKVAIYDKQNNKMISFGWIATADVNLKGWTITKYDWESFIKRKNKEGAGNNGR